MSLTFASERDLCLARAGIVGGPARVRARILRDEPHNVQGHVAKVVDGPEAMAHRDGSTIFEPLHVEVGISNRLQLGLEVGVVALDQAVEAAGRGDKAGREAGLHLLLPGQPVGLALGGSGVGGGGILTTYSIQKTGTKHTLNLFCVNVSICK